MKKEISNSSRKWFVVSDIHGFYKELMAALRAAGFDKRNKNHTLIVCGDVFDRGGEALDVYRFLSSLPKKRCILVKGNHEYLYEDLLDKKFPDSHDFSNRTADTFCQIAGYDADILRSDYWYRLGEQNPYERTQQAWAEIREEVKASKVTEWLKSDRWKNYYELDRYIFTHSFIPLKNLDGLPGYYIECRRFEYSPDWRVAASTREWYDATWGCPYALYQAGYFEREAANGKVLVCGHWNVTDFRERLLGYASDDTGVFYYDHLIGLDGGVWRPRDGSGKYIHPQNVLVIDDSDFGVCYDQHGETLRCELAVGA